VRPLSLLLSCVLLASPALADDLAPFLKQSPDAKNAKSVPSTPAQEWCSFQGFATGNGAQCPVASASSFCTDLNSCKTFCCCACDFDLTKWKGENPYDGSASCPRSPQGGPGTIDPGYRDLKDLYDTLKGSRYLTSYGGKSATRAVANGLKRLDTYLSTWQKRKDNDFKVKVKNCYRRAIGNTKTELDGNTEGVCGMVYKLMRNEGQPGVTDQKYAAMEADANNRVWDMTWPGATPHSSGVACDLVLIDKDGAECFDLRDTDQGPRCSIEKKLAISLLNEAATSAEVGAKRLDYEAWHFEWGGGDKCRCSGSDCDKITPLDGSVRCP